MSTVPGGKALECSDNTIRGQTDQLVTVPCDTFCLIGYSVNSFLDAFEGIDSPICQSLGCATVQNGTFVNDAADRLGAAASGKILVYGCDNTTFAENPDALQVDVQSGLPCNYYNPDGASGVVDLSDQGCVNLDVIGTAEVDPSWILENLGLFLGLLFTGIALLIGGSIACCCCLRRRAGKGNQFKDFIELNPGMTKVNFFAFLLVGGSTIMLLVFLNAMQAFLLSEVYGVSEDDFGKTTGQLAVADEIWSFVWLFVWGVVSDITGRRVVVGIGFFICGVALFLSPHGGEVFPGLLLIRLLFAQGGAALATILTALLSDIVAPPSLGIVAGILGLASGIGALFAVFVLVGVLPVSLCIENTYYFVGSLALGLGLVAFLALPTKAQTLANFDKHHQEEHPDRRHPFTRSLEIVKQSFQLLLQRPSLASSYVAGFCARAGSVVVSAYITLWVVRYYRDNDICNETNEQDLTSCRESLVDLEESLCASAFRVASRISGLAQVSALIFALVCGYISTRPGVDIQKCLFFAALFGVAAYGAVPAFPDPLDRKVYIIAILWGAAEIAMIIFAQVAVAQEMVSVPNLRGVIAGTYSAVGSLGIVLVTYFGGWLFDIWNPAAPFVLLSIASLVVAATSLAVILYKRPPDSEEGHKARGEQLVSGDRSEKRLQRTAPKTRAARMISGLLLINQQGEIVLFRAYRDDVSRSAAEAFRMQVVAKKETGTLAPVRLVDGTTFLHTRCNDMFFTALTKSNVNTALVFEYLFQLRRILAAYLGENFSERDIRNYFTLVYELLDETMDFGYPQNCSVEALKLYINLGKVQEATKTPSAITAKITGAIDWRQPGIKHKTNEVFIYVMEEVSVMVSAEGTVLSSEVRGLIKMKVFLSGMPECKIALNDKLSLDLDLESTPSKEDYVIGGQAHPTRDVSLADCSFHRCVRLGNFDADRTITFMPPDGEFDLMKYRITENVELPFKVIPVVEEMGRTKLYYNIRLVAEYAPERNASNIVLKIPCPSNAAKVRPVVGKGRAKYDPAQHAIIWRIRRLSGESEVTFNCAVDLVANTKEKAWSRPPIQVDFNVPMYAASGLNVRFLKVVEESRYNTIKWVRYVTKAGNFQIRM
ncbi:AP-2 complex subunit mu (Clathrin assembly protein complex 2 mu medium chain) (Clathrin coat assembly protein AP50) (Clathrin coat-associated protein AP50) (Clathrin-adaptor medium chain Apm2) (Mu2-adaptin) (Plasma membrane adaptor AP-2 50 kDa protein) [Durusdinium trenchii]|uniref:AP-2 complex subunit mu n=1 Tax=Durusdinium trenchii TaxID=1381693 RepID=A0ABP0Q6N2_9DINO